MSKLPNWEVLFWKLAVLVLMGWNDEAVHFIGTVLSTPLVVKDETD